MKAGPVGALRAVLAIACLGISLGCSTGQVLEAGEQRDADGELVASGPLMNGDKHGYWTTYGRDGGILLLRGYDAGEPHGKWLEWDSDGKLIGDAEYRHGKRWNGAFVDVGGVAVEERGGERWLLRAVTRLYSEGVMTTIRIEYEAPPRPPSVGKYRAGAPWTGVFLHEITDEEMMEHMAAGFVLYEYKDGKPVGE